MKSSITRRSPVPLILMITALVAVAAAWPSAGSAEEFINLRFYPGEEPSPENRPSGQSPVTLSFSGKIYQPAEAPFGGGSPRTPDEDFVVRAVQVHREGSRAEILALWDPSEREYIGQKIDDPKELSRNRTFYQNMKDTAFLLRVRYGPYLLFLVQTTVEGIGDQIRVYPIRKTGSGYVLTNALADDPILKFLYDLYRERVQPSDDSEAATPETD